MKKGSHGAKCAVGWIVWILVIVGALNWGLVGFFDFDLVAAIFGDMSTVSRVVYALVGVSAIAMIVGCPCKKCKAGKGSKGGMCVHCKK